jgi:hypothetical protein
LDGNSPLSACSSSSASLPFALQAANNLAGLLNPPVHPNDTMGSVEVGGASAQVAFIPDADVMLPPEYQWNISVGDTHYNIYVNSYLGFGATETRYDINATIALNVSSGLIPENGSVILNPCFNTNFTETVYTTFNGTPVVYNLVGSGAYYDCSCKLFSSILRLKKRFAYRACFLKL